MAVGLGSAGSVGTGVAVGASVGVDEGWLTGGLVFVGAGAEVAGAVDMALLARVGAISGVSVFTSAGWAVLVGDMDAFNEHAIVASAKTVNNILAFEISLGFID